jgi:hypothetical protein
VKGEPIAHTSYVLVMREQQSIRRSNLAQVPGTRALVRNSLYCDQVPVFPHCGPGASRLDKIEEQARVDFAAAQGETAARSRSRVEGTLRQRSAADRRHAKINSLDGNS